MSSNSPAFLSNPLPLHTYYVVQKGVKYIAIDNHSGGYPYDTDFVSAQRYTDLVKAVNSMQHNDGTAVIECKVYGEVVHQSQVDYHLKMQALAKLTPDEIRALGLGG